MCVCCVYELQAANERSFVVSNGRSGPDGANKRHIFLCSNREIQRRGASNLPQQWRQELNSWRFFLRSLLGLCVLVYVRTPPSPFFRMPRSRGGCRAASFCTTHTLPVFHGNLLRPEREIRFALPENGRWRREEATQRGKDNFSVAFWVSKGSYSQRDVRIVRFCDY